MELLDTKSDLNWLAEVHLKGIPLSFEWAGFKSALLHGAEDAPARVDLYLSDSPLVTDKYLRIDFNPPEHEGSNWAVQEVQP